MIIQNDKFKDSGIEWIGKIPTTWNVTRISAEFKVRNQKVNDKDYMPLSVTKLTDGIVPQLEQVAKSDAHEDRKLVLKGDFVINSRSDRKMSCGVSIYDGSVSLINIVLEPIGEISSEFTHYLFKNYYFAEEFYRWGHGIVADLWTTNSSDLKRIYIPVPSKNEQIKIVTTLNEKISKIDLLISNQEKQIEKLKEYKQALITKVVTNGLSDNPEMKSSGVEWIGKIPCGWNIYPIKYLFSFSKGLSITKEDLRENGVKVISYGQLHSKKNLSVKVDNSLYRFVSKKYLESNPECLVNVNDMIMADTSEDLEGTCDFVRIDKEEKIFAGYHSIIFQNKQKINTEYLAYQFTTDIWRNQFRSKVNGVKLFSLTQKILNQGLVIFPDECNQKAIVDYINKKCGKIYQLIEIKQQKIEKLNEYKKSIIYEYVTGKKEVQL